MLKEALTLLETAEEFMLWLDAHQHVYHNDSILYFLTDFLADRGYPGIKFWISTWPTFYTGDGRYSIETQQVTTHWIVNLQEHFGQRLAVSFTGKRVLEVLATIPSTYSLIKPPPSH